MSLWHSPVGHHRGASAIPSINATRGHTASSNTTLTILQEFAATLLNYYIRAANLQVRVAIRDSTNKSSSSVCVCM